MIGEPDDFDVIHLAVRDVCGKLIGQRLFFGRIDERVQRMHVADQRALRVSEIRHCSIVRPWAG